MIVRVTVAALLLCLAPAGAAQDGGWQANARVVEEAAKRQPTINYREERAGAYTLPDPLQTPGGRVASPAAWPARRTAILELFRQHVYGVSPGAPRQVRFEPLEEAAAMDGAATLTRVRIVSDHEGRQHQFTLTMFLPAASRGPVPLFLLLNNRPESNTDPTRREKSGFWPAEEMVGRGYGIAALQVSELAPDDKDRFREGAMRLFEPAPTGVRPANAWGALAAWAWGASRAMDYFVTDRRIDAGRVAVVGHSRGGKAALWAGAEDERFAMVVSNESGEGGAALSRRHFGETLARITDAFPHWFAGRYKEYAGRVDALPVDQHMLLALVAPRALYVASADEDLWADPRGEYLAQVHASPVYALFGEPAFAAGAMPALNEPLVAGRRGYHVRNGGHSLTPYDWQRFADFADRVWEGTRQKAEGKREQAPNILLIQADDLGFGDLSAYGQARFETTSLDRLAREGTRFTQYYSGSTVCAPSRYSLLTGWHSGHAWIRGNAGPPPGDTPLRPEDVTIAEVLRTAGYRTAVIGKWGLGQPGTTGQPDRQGFDYSFGFLDHRHAHRQYTDHLYRNAERVATDVERDYVNDLFTSEALAFIGREDGRPFFLYLNYTVPHAELRAPEDAVAPFRARFQEQPFSNPKADAQQTGARPDAASLGYRSQPAPHAAFAAMITRMDRDIGRLVDLLRTRGLEANTLVLFTSDNGPHREGGADPAFFNSSGALRGIKRDLYEGGIRVPMIARWPGTIPAARVSDHVWAHWDMLPTLAELAGAQAPDGLDGMSMARALRGQPQPTHAYLYWEFHERGFQQAVRMGHWKGLRLKPGAPLELYDLSADPREGTDVAAANPDAVRQIEAYLKTARTPSARWPGQ